MSIEVITGIGFVFTCLVVYGICHLGDNDCRCQDPEQEEDEK